MFTGEYQHNIDAKGRVAVPAKLREDLGVRFVVARGLDGCLTLYPMGEWERLMEKINNLPMAKSRPMRRFFCAGADQVEPDKQGRIGLTPALRKYAGLEGPAVIVGAGAYAEIWSREKWEEQYASITSDSVEELMNELNF